MMTLAEIRKMPTCVDNGPNRTRVHESVLRSYQLVLKVRELCDKQTPHEVISEIITDVMSAPPSDHKTTNEGID